MEQIIFEKRLNELNRINGEQRKKILYSINELRKEVREMENVHLSKMSMYKDRIASLEDAMREVDIKHMQEKENLYNIFLKEKNETS